MELLSCKINHDKTPPVRVAHLSSGRSGYVRRPRMGRVADASARKKYKHPHGDDDESTETYNETEYYKVS